MDPTQTPDLVSAMGGGQQDPSSLLAIMSLMRPPMATPASPHAQQVALQQQQMQQQQMTLMLGLLKDQQNQQASRAEKAQALAEKKREFDLRQSELRQSRQDREYDRFMTLGGTLFQNEDTREVGAKFLIEGLKKMGRGVPEALLAPSAKQLKDKDRKNLLVDVELGYSDDALLRMYPGATPELIKDMRGLERTPTLSKYLGLPSKEDIQKEALDIKLKQIQILESDPLIKGDPKLAQKAATIFADLYGGSILDGTTEQKKRAVDMAVLQQNADTLKQHEDMERMKARVKAEFKEPKEPKPIKYVADDASAVWTNKKGELAGADLSVEEARKAGFFRVTTREYDQMGTAAQANIILKNMMDTITEMEDNNLFVESSGVSGIMERLTIEGKKRLGDPKISKRLLATFGSQKAQMVILLRQLGDKGVRALGAFAPAMDAISTSSGSPAVRQVLSQIESEVKALGQASRMPEAVTQRPVVFKSPNTPTPGGRRMTVVDKSTKKRLVIELEPNETLDESRYEVVR